MYPGGGGEWSVVESPGKPLLDRESWEPFLRFSARFFFYTVVTPIHQTLLDGIEMLHFRSTVALKELFQTPLKGPLTGRVGAVKAAPAASACFSSAVSLDGRSPGRGRAFAGWRAPPPPPHFTRRHAVRGFCSKGDGQNEAGKDASAEK